MQQKRSRLVPMLLCLLLLVSTVTVTSRADASEAIASTLTGPAANQYGDIGVTCGRASFDWRDNSLLPIGVNKGDFACNLDISNRAARQLYAWADDNLAAMATLLGTEIVKLEVKHIVESEIKSQLENLGLKVLAGAAPELAAFVVAANQIASWSSKAAKYVNALVDADDFYNWILTDDADGCVELDFDIHGGRAQVNQQLVPSSQSNIRTIDPSVANDRVWDHSSHIRNFNFTCSGGGQIKTRTENLSYLFTGSVTSSIIRAPALFANAATPDSYTVEAGTALTIPAPGVLANDTFDGQSPIGISLQTQSFAADEWTWGGDGGFQYRAPANDAGVQKTFTYEAVYPEGSAEPITVNINVLPPRNRDDAYTVPAGETLNVQAPGVLSNDTIPGGIPVVQAQLDSQSFAASEWQWGGGDGGFTYAAGPGAAGLVKTFTYTPVDVNGDLLPVATSSITITPAKDRDNAYTVPAGEELKVPAPGILANDSEADGTPAVSAQLDSQSFGGSEWQWGNGDGGFTYFAGAGAAGLVKTFTYTPITADGHSLPEATVTIAITPSKDRDDVYSVAAGQSLVIQPPGILANDTAADGTPAVSAQLDSQSFAGSEWQWGNGNGGFTYNAGIGAAGLVKSFTYTPVQADGFALPPATVTITITPPDGIPVTQGTAFVIHGGTTGTRTLAAAGTYGCQCVSAPYGVGAWQLVSQSFASSSFNFVWNGDGSFSLSPSARQDGDNLTFQYRVVDSRGVVSNTSTVTLQIR